MLKKIVCLGCALLGAGMLRGAEPITGTAATGWEIRTAGSLYRLTVDPKDNIVKSEFLGPLSLDARPAGGGLPEVPVPEGRRLITRPQVEVTFPDGVRDVELTFESGEIRTIDGRPTLVIRQRDKVYPLRITAYIRPVPELDILEKWVDVHNFGKKEIRVANLLSGTLFLPRDQYKVTTLQGEWGDEFVPETTTLTTGTKTIEVRDHKSYGSSFFTVRPQGDESYTAGPVWFGMLLYSGNWRVDFHKRFSDFVEIQGGINFWDASWQLTPGETLTAPKMLVGYTRSGEEGASQRVSDYVRTELLRPAKREQPRPVVYNSWYATTFDVNETHQYELAKVAKEIGVELFMMDDGWFKGRLDDKAGLGDWTVDKTKFPNGLNSLIEKINALGLDFGIWVEPEMVNPNSDLYRAHPDWIVHYPNRDRGLYRHQSTLNLAREDVYQYLLKSLSDLLSQHNIKYLKWDHNRGLSQPGWPGETPQKQLEMRLRYMNNLYRLLDELRVRFPDVWFENCSSGGGRVDGEMLRRMDINWTSDHTGAISRQFIQYGYLAFMPANTMLGLVTHEDYEGFELSLDYKFNVTMQGVLGIGYDISKWGPEDRALAAEKIALYKAIRPTVQGGKLYRLISPYSGERTALEYVARDGSEAVLMLYNREVLLKEVTAEASASKKLLLRGLEPSARYTAEGYEGTFTGAYLMETGLDWPLGKAFTSRIIRVQRQ